MENWVAISLLSDFSFCPYSVYLHNVYKDTDKGIYQALPQVRGTMAHESVDNKTSSTLKTELQALPIISDQLGVMGKIDIYRTDEKLLIERKYRLKQVYRGRLYQLWAQYYCMLEMGYEVEKLAFYEISTNTTMPISLPSEDDKQELMDIIEEFKNYDPMAPLTTNVNKCRHCIYCNLCDKTDTENVYQ